MGLPSHSNAKGAAPDRRDLVAGLEVVLEETRDRIAINLEKMRGLSEELREDWSTYRSSLNLRNRFAHGQPIEPEFMDVMNSTMRWLMDMDRPRRPEGGAPVARAYGGGPAHRPVPMDRIAQIERVIAANNGQPMDTSEITSALEARGWLRGVTDPRATVSAALSRGHRQGVLERVFRGTYQMASPEVERGRGPDGGDQGKPTSIASQEESA
jgi:hypothetical protein